MLSVKKLFYKVMESLNEKETEITSVGTRVTTLEGKMPIKVEVASFSSLPQTVSSTAITSGMECVSAVLGTPSAQTSDWTVTTSNGSLTISGSMSGSTTATLYLITP